MTRARRLVETFAFCVVMSATAASAQDANAVIAEALRTIGATNLTSITYSGNAAQGNFGQSRTITFGVASTSIRNYTRTIDFTTSTARITGDTTPPGVRGGPPPQPGTLDQTIAADAPWVLQHQIWVTPWGFLRGAAANHATVRTQKIDGEPYRVVTWMTTQKAPSGLPYKVVGYINGSNLVERVETWIDHPVLGDEHREFFYSDYRDFGGISAPLRMTQKQVGMETFVAATATVRANPADLTALLTATARAGAAPPQGPPAPSAVTSEKLADGVYRITGGYVSMAVEFRDFIVVLEGGQSEARGLAVLAETKRLFPNKRVKYVVNTHPHFDHASGLAPFAAEGITILADDNAKYFLGASLGTPRSLVGDAFAKSKKKPKVEGVVEKQVITDGARTLELHHVAGLEHSDSMLIAYLPKEKILFCADFRLPNGQPDPSLVTLRENVDRLQLDIERVVMVHAPNPDRPISGADLLGPAKGTH
jgi:glyoxylase-like metal-dependent hydrolase (beta-lactamase superfamily II)